MSQITVRGRIATTSLARGETATVEHTSKIDRLIAGGYLEQIGGGRPPRRGAPATESAEEATAMATTAEESATEAETPATETEGAEPEAEAEATTQARRGRKKSTS